MTNRGRDAACCFLQGKSCSGLRQPSSPVSCFSANATAPAPGHLEHLHFPNESTSGRQARTALLEEEMELRRHVERVAQQRRAPPSGGELPEDYVFEGRRVAAGRDVFKLSELFAPCKDDARDLQLHVRPGARRTVPRLHALPRWRWTARRCISASASTSSSWRSRRSSVCRTSPSSAAGSICGLLSTADNTYDRDYYGDLTALSEALRDAIRN